MKTTKTISFPFLKCLLFQTISFFSPLLLLSQSVDYGKSYVNITKGLNGGTIEAGDTLEIRATFVVMSPSAYYVDSCAFYDTIKTGVAYIPGTLAVLTNEGKIYKAFTDSYGDDCGFISGNNIQINMGYNSANKPATAFRRGRISNSDKPSFYSNTCIMIASYKVKVTAALNSLINTGGGSISYKPNGVPIKTISFPYNNAIISTNFGICSNTVGTNALGTEYNGTFGSGKNRNRTASSNVPATYTYNIFGSSSPQDYYYGIPNNTSIQSGYTFLDTWPKPDAAHRVHSVWDIIGDHTGAVSPTAGNPAADTVNNPNAGYMLVVNASYRIDSAFSHTISGLCPNTYYELSAWFRNICSKCGCDSNGKGATGGSGYIPTAPGDSSGVYPNLTLRVNGIDYYTTGYMKYTGQWIKKGFTYITGPAETSLTMTIRNNAPGGGGNDWAIDDISIATCTPTLTLVPSGGVNVCYGNQVDMYTTVRCFSPNYIYWTWERSTNGGATWTNTGVSGIGSPTYVAGAWVYNATYPSFTGDSSYHNNMFRMRVASTPGNLSDSACSFTASNTIIIWVNQCSVILNTLLTSFKGELTDGKARLQWSATQEQPGVMYEIQRADDNRNFQKIGIIAGFANSANNFYEFTDPLPIKGNSCYRLRIIEGAVSSFSKTILLSNGNNDFNIKSLLNPFQNKISFDLISPHSGTVQAQITDCYGRIIRIKTFIVNQGWNHLLFQNLEDLRAGYYILTLKMDSWQINRQIVKATTY